MTLVLPRRLVAPDPGWMITADVIVVGSGIAGLTVALGARSAGLRVLLVTKARIEEGSTQWAQGGIAAALAEEDSPDDHCADTLVAGAGLCDPAAVRALVMQGPSAVRGLIELGMRFDRTAAGALALTREGGHLRDRIVHAGGDATGAEVMRALTAAVHPGPEFEVVEHALALDLLQDASGAAQGITLHVMGEGQRDGVGAALAPAVVLATGGLGQIYSQTTNPAVATGDGVALALRAGAAVADLEFVQFHPTVMWLGPTSSGQQPLVSEAVRGEGAVLVDDDGVQFMVAEHPLADLAPRDVVAKAIMRRMLASGRPNVWLDGRRLGESIWRHRFPTILAQCRAAGITPWLDLIPVAPAQHYASGGIYTDLDGRASIPGLFACGEVSCTGVHGANRLASNSLLEGLVFAERIGSLLASELPARGDVTWPFGSNPGAVLCDDVRPVMQQAMLAGAGVLRSQERLTETLAGLAGLACDAGEPCTSTWETTNLYTVATAVATAALQRTETRGSHWREDYPARDDAKWRVRQVMRLDSDGRLRTALRSVVGGAQSVASGSSRFRFRAGGAMGMAMSGHVRDGLLAAGLDADAVAALIETALAEDLDDGFDVTSQATVPPDQRCVLDLVARQSGVLSGAPIAAAVFELVCGAACDIVLPLPEGSSLQPGSVVLSVTGPTRDVLTAERTALNLLGHLCGVATATASWVAAVAASGAVVRDTRKTIPGLRMLQKYAVRCGGGTNHRMGLFDAALIKDNHVAAAGGVVQAYRAVRDRWPEVPVQVEVDSLAQFREVLAVGAREVLLDNFTLAQLREAVAINKGRAVLEASGGLTLSSAAAVAATGVNSVAVGALTHSAPVLDIGADYRVAV